MNIKIGAKIKSLRKRDGVTQEKLADALGVTAQAVSKWESEIGYPDLEYLTPIANFFNVTIDELFGHDLDEKQRKIDEYCARYDDLARNWSPPEERVELMRQALAEFPANEKLLFRLAQALWYKWEDAWRSCDEIGVTIDGKYRRDQNKIRAVPGWEEPCRIMEELLAVSVDDLIRYECTQLLIFIYSCIGEKERAIELAERYPDSKDSFLSVAFMNSYDDEADMYSQRLMIDGLHNLHYQLLRQVKTPADRIAAANKLIDLYSFLFGEDCGFYHVHFYYLYLDLVSALLDLDRTDDAFSELNHAFEHAKAFDEFLDKLRKEGEYLYSSPFVSKLKSKSEGVYATKQLPEFLENVLLDRNDIYFKTLHDDQRFVSLVERIKEAIKREK